MKKKITIALAGNPNSGKTTIFNNLTGSRQHVGNYPGVTVEIKEGTCQCQDTEIRVVDLPGTYSLTANSLDELAARNYIVREKPDVVVNILDSCTLERNLYLTTQIMELGVPLVLVFNMSDEAKCRGLEFDIDQLSKLLGAPIVRSVGNKGEGTKELVEAVLAVAAQPQGREDIKINYGRDIEKELAKIQKLVERGMGQDRPESVRWLAIKLLEKDKEVSRQITSPELQSAVERSAEHLKKLLGDHPENLIADRRYGFISGACQEAVQSSAEIRHELSDKIDTVLINRFLGFPIFLGLMFLVFHFTFTLGNPAMELVEAMFGWMGKVITGWWPVGTESWVQSLLVDGIIGGVGGVVIFLPNIIFLFLAIALLEDTGYMARAAFIMDRLMHKIGLHGKSFIPMMIGLGCSIPAIMATRTLAGRQDRLTTMMVVPLMSCGARLPIYTLIAPAFFPQVWQAPVVMIMYLTGALLAIIGAKVLRFTVFKGESTPFVMELPPYRVPTMKSLFNHTWERAWMYLKKAGTVILAISIALWVLTSYPKKPDSKEVPNNPVVNTLEKSAITSEDSILEKQHQSQAEDLAYSFAGRIGHLLEPLLKPMGFDWRIGTALMGAFAAKEVFVAQMGIVFAVGEADEESDTLREKLQRNYTPLVGICIMLFCLISAPCMATIAVTWQESGSWKWALFQLGGLTLLAYVLTLMVYQTGILLGFGSG